MKLLMLCLALAGLGPDSQIDRVYVFQGQLGPIAVVGYLQTRGPEALGTLWWRSPAGDDSVRLAGFCPPGFGPDRWLHRGSWTVLCASDEALVVGGIYWHGDRGVLDVLSVDGEWGEIPVTVEIR